VTLYVLDEDVEFGVELHVAWVHLHKLEHQVVDGMVFLLGPLYHFAGAVSLAPDGRVKDLLFQDTVDIKLDEACFGNRLLGRLVLGFLELPKQLSHPSVIFPQHLQRVHAQIPPRSIHVGTLGSMRAGGLHMRKHGPRPV
jgi:hypothetical protein